MANSIIKNPHTIKYVDYTTESTTFPQNTPIRFNVPLQTGETSLDNRISAFSVVNRDFIANITADGRLYLQNTNPSTTTAVKVRIYYYN